MEYTHFFSVLFIFWIFYIKVGVSTEDSTSKNSSLSITSHDKKSQPGINESILSAIEEQFKVNGSVIQAMMEKYLSEYIQNTTAQVPIDQPSETTDYQTSGETVTDKNPEIVDKKVDLVTNSIAFRIGDVFANSNESEETKAEEISTILSNIYEEIGQVTLTIHNDVTTKSENQSGISDSTVDPITNNTLGKTELTTAVPGIIKEYLVPDEAELLPVIEQMLERIKYEREKGINSKDVLSVRVVDLTLMLGLLKSIPRVKNALMKLNNTEPAIDQEPNQNSSLAKVSRRRREVSTRLTGLNDVDTDLNNSTKNHSKPKRTIKLTRSILNRIKNSCQSIRNILGFRRKKVPTLTDIQNRVDRRAIEICLNELNALLD